MIENRDWIDEYEIKALHTEAHDWDADIVNDPNPPFFLEEVKFDWKEWRVTTSARRTRSFHQACMCLYVYGLGEG